MIDNACSINNIRIDDGGFLLLSYFVVVVTAIKHNGLLLHYYCDFAVVNVGIDGVQSNTSNSSSEATALSSLLKIN